MRERDFNTGLRGGLFEAKHYARMGAAVWLYGWLVLRQTHQSAGVGYVLGGAPITYREIEDETGFNKRTLEGWMRVLRREGYIRTLNVPAGISVQILKAKKHRLNRVGAAGRTRVDGCATRQTEFFSHEPRDSRFPHEGVRGSAGQFRELAEGGPRFGVASGVKVGEIQRLAAPMGSSSVEGLKESFTLQTDSDQSSFPWSVPTHSEAADLQNSLTNKGESRVTARDYESRVFEAARSRSNEAYSPLERKPATPSEYQPQRLNQIQHQKDKFPWELRKRMQMIRAERDEQVRRELYVGTGPEGRR
jgi:hypothetical protein